MSNFNTGDTVGHKSGGPVMVVTEAGTYQGTSVQYVATRWWADGEFKTDQFRPQELKPV